MAKRENIIKIDRLRNAVFWHWEYMRRNPIYIKYWDRFEFYFNYFDEIGVSAFINSAEHIDLAYGSANNPEEESANIDLVMEKMFEADGDKGINNYIKFGCLSNGFAKKFFMPPKAYIVEDYSYEDMFDCILTCDDCLFQNFDVCNCISLCSIYNWMFSAQDPVAELYDFAIQDNLIFSPSKMESSNLSKNVGLEAGAINVTKQVTNLCVDYGTSIDNFTYEKMKDLHDIDLDGVIEDKQLEDIYDLIIKPRKLNLADEMRLCGLWMWDNYDHFTADPEAEFERVLGELRIKLKGITYKPWDQVHTRIKRMRKYFQTTCLCIEKYTVLPMSYAKYC